MYPYSGRDDNDNSSRRTKAIAAIPMAGILVAAGLLSGLALASTSLSQVAIAQNLTAGGGGGGATNATMGTNATTAGGGGNQSAVSEATMHINEAMSAAQSGDMQGVMMHLRLALNVLGNMTSTTAAGGNMTGTTGGTTMTQSNQNNVI